MTNARSELATVGILGAGKVGTAVARQAIAAGLRVKIATARPADEIALLVDVMVPGAEAVEVADAVDADLVIVAVPLPKYRTLNAELLAGKIVIDAMNYWAPTDGAMDDFERDGGTSSEVIQEFLASSRVVKSINHIGYHDMDADGRPAGASDRRALALAGDDAAAKHLVAAFIDRIGFDPVDAGPLAAGRAFQPGTDIFNGRHNADALMALLNRACEHVAA